MPDALLTAAGAGGVLTLGVGGAVLAEALVRRTRPGGGLGRPVAFALVSVALLSAVAVRYRGEPLLAAAYLVLAAVTVPLSASDVAEHRIPDRILGPASALTGVLLAVDAVVRHTPGSFVRALLCAAVLGAAALAVILLVEEGLGLGDVKLALVVGAALGYFSLFDVARGTVTAFLAGGLYAAGRRAFRRQSRQRELPFAPFMLIGAFITLIFAAL